MDSNQAKETIKVKLEKFKISLLTGLTTGTNFGYQLFIEERPLY
jgi:hypothetical protein